MAHATSINLTDQETHYLKSVTRQRTIQAQVVDRARILLYKAQGIPCYDIAERLDININTVKLCLSKFKTGGIQQALFDEQRKGRPIEISEEASAWISNIACQSPMDFGFSMELWTMQTLCNYIRQNAELSGYPRLTTITKPMIGKILQRADYKALKITRRRKKDYDFEAGIHEILAVYENVGCKSGGLSILAGIDLLTTKIIPVISEAYSRLDMIRFLDKLDGEYPLEDQIRIICNLHEFKSKEVRDYLSTRPVSRFSLVSASVHSPWLNLTESLLKRIVKQMSREIHFNTSYTPIEQMTLRFDEINDGPVVYRWTYKLDDVSIKEIDSDKAVL